MNGPQTKVGGKPTWIQGEVEAPRCYHGGNPMRFIGQLDTAGSEVMLGDAGIVYVFACPCCRDAKAIVQEC